MNLNIDVTLSELAEAEGLENEGFISEIEKIFKKIMEVINNGKI